MKDICENDNILIITGEQVNTLLKGKKPAIIELIKDAYLTHDNGKSALPNSLFLRFPNDKKKPDYCFTSVLGR